jgi:hypothetical protein
VKQRRKALQEQYQVAAEFKPGSAAKEILSGNVDIFAKNPRNMQRRKRRVCNCTVKASISQGISIKRIYMHTSPSWSAPHKRFSSDGRKRRNGRAKKAKKP